MTTPTEDSTWHPWVLGKNPDDGLRRSQPSTIRVLRDELDLMRRAALAAVRLSHTRLDRAEVSPNIRALLHDIPRDHEGLHTLMTYLYDTGFLEEEAAHLWNDYRMLEHANVAAQSAKESAWRAYDNLFLRISKLEGFSAYPE